MSSGILFIVPKVADSHAKNKEATKGSTSRTDGTVQQRFDSCAFELRAQYLFSSQNIETRRDFSKKIVKAKNKANTHR